MMRVSPLGAATVLTSRDACISLRVSRVRRAGIPARCGPAEEA
jgi:hypothetical protein